MPSKSPSRNGKPSDSEQGGNQRSDSEVEPRVTRRRFTADEKARILQAYEEGSALERAAICRRERIYSSHIANWRKQLSSGKPLDAKRGAKPNPVGVENTRLKKEIAALEKRLAKAERVLDIQGKVYAVLQAVAGKSADELESPPSKKL
jgi:transposase-like protein